MLKFTKEKMNAHAQTLCANTDRAQCYNIANLIVGNNRTIAETIKADHQGLSDAKRASQLMVDAGCAKEINAKKDCYGTFVFEDDSELS